MPTSRRKQILDALAAVSQEEEPNPFHDLGIDSTFARRLLSEDPTGDRLQKYADRAAQTLLAMYHPDRLPDKEAIFRAVDAARARVAAASGAALMGWARDGGASVPSARDRQERERKDKIASRATAWLSQAVAQGRSPRHFSQFELSQGLIVNGNSGIPLLIRRRSEGGLRVQRGAALAPDTLSGAQSSANAQAFDFHQFLRQNHLFGLEPGARVAAYRDGRRATILDGHSLAFLMDVSGPVDEYRASRKSEVDKAASAWAQVNDPVLLITQVPSEHLLEDTASQLVTFPGSTSSSGTRGTVWNLPSLEVAGTLGDAGFFERNKHAKHAGAAAIAGSGGRVEAGYFSMVATPLPALVEQDAQYSSLMDPGSLLLFDSKAEVPVATNATVVGMLGNGSQH